MNLFVFVKTTSVFFSSSVKAIIRFWRSRIKLLMNLKVCVETIKPSPINFRKRWKISLRLRSSPNFFPMLWKSWKICALLNFLFDRHREGVVRYGCMAHVRRKFVEALHADSRSAKVVQLISELYWIELDCRIHFLSESERALERQKRSIPILQLLFSPRLFVMRCTNGKLCAVTWTMVRPR